MKQQLKIEEATDEQLRGYSNAVLGTSIPGNAKRETILAKMTGTGFSKDYIELEEPGEPLKTVKPPKADGKRRDARGRVLVTILVQRTEEKGGDQPVPVAVNGVAMFIPRGRPVDVPEPYVEAIDNAVKRIYESNDDGNGLKPEAREVPMYPFQRIA